MNKEKYPEVLDKDNWDGYDFEDIDSNGTYKQDYEEALVYQKKNGGEVYTMHDDEGCYVYYQKGLHYVNRLGFCVVKKEENN